MNSLKKAYRKLKAIKIFVHIQIIKTQKQIITTFWFIKCTVTRNIKFRRKKPNNNKQHRCMCCAKLHKNKNKTRS